MDHYLNFQILTVCWLLYLPHHSPSFVALPSALVGSLTIGFQWALANVLKMEIGGQEEREVLLFIFLCLLPRPWFLQWYIPLPQQGLSDPSSTSGTLSRSGNTMPTYLYRPMCSVSAPLLVPCLHYSLLVFLKSFCTSVNTPFITLSLMKLGAHQLFPAGS